MSTPQDRELRSILSETGNPDPAALLELVPLLPERLLPRALEIALDVRYPAMDLRAHLAEILAERIAKAHPNVIRKALGVARANLLRTQGGAESAVVKALAPVLPEDLLPAALQIANHIPSLEKRISALAALAVRLPSEDSQTVLGDALERAAEFKDEYTRLDRLSALIPYLPDSLLSKSLEMVLESKSAEISVGLLIELAPYLSIQKRRSAIDAALSGVVSYKRPLWQAQALEDMEPFLSEPGLFKKALTAAEKIQDKSIRIQALVALAGGLPEDERYKRASKWAKHAYKVQALHEKAAALAQVAPFLHSKERPPVLTEIIQSVRKLRKLKAPTEPRTESDWRDPDERAGGLIELAKHLPDRERIKIIKEGLRDVKSVDPDWADQLREDIAPPLPQPPPFPLKRKTPGQSKATSRRRSQVMRQINAALRLIQREPGHIDGVVFQLDFIPAEKRGQIVSRIVDALKSIPDEYMLEEKIILLAPCLEEIHLEQVLFLAQNIKAPPLRSRALVALALRFPQTRKPPLVDEALAAVETVKDVERYASQLSEIAPVLSETQKDGSLRLALSRMREVRKSQEQVEIIWALAPHFPPNLLPQAWVEAKRIRARDLRASALTELAPFFLPENRPEVLGDALQDILALGEDGARYLEKLALILTEPLLKQAVSAAKDFKNDLGRADTLSALLAELAGYATGEERWPILRAAFEDAFRSAVPRGGGKGGKSDPETGSEAGERARQLLQELPQSEAQALLEGWLGPLSAQTRSEMAFFGRSKAGFERAMFKHAKPPPAPERVVNTGFALRSEPDQCLDSDDPLAAGEYYYFWLDVDKLDPRSIEIQPSPLPVRVETKPVLLRVVLYAFRGEIGITAGADIGTLELQLDGSAVVKRQPGGQAAPLNNRALLLTRLYFPVQAPDREGTFRLRCHIYYEQILVQARLIEAQVMRSPQKAVGALQSRLDYSLAQSLRPEHLGRLQPHRLSLMLNDNGDATHTLRFFSEQGGEPKKYDAHLLPTELEIPMLNARKALWKASWGDENPWDPEHFPGQKYRYKDEGFDLERLEKDLISLSVSGYILYNAIIDKLTGGRRLSDELADLMRLPGLVQIALRQSPSQILPAALFYDYSLDTQAPHSVCETFKAALLNHTQLENTPCFQGACPSLGKPGADRCVCPSGFWGFRHWLGLPFSAAPGKDLPPDIVVHGPLQMLVGVATNLDRVDEHLKALKDIRPGLGWHESEHRDEILDMMKAVRAHVIYFYCHGGVARNVPFLQVGGGNEYFEGSNLRAKQIFWDSPQPLVFVNGCHTTALDPRQVISLVQDFVATGGAGVIGTEITIFETLACDFAEEFLANFLKLHVSIGKAVRNARLRLLEKGNPLGLVYTPFVLPSLQLLG